MESEPKRKRLVRQSQKNATYQSPAPSLSSSAIDTSSLSEPSCDSFLVSHSSLGSSSSHAPSESSATSTSSSVSLSTTSESADIRPTAKTQANAADRPLSGGLYITEPDKRCRALELGKMHLIRTAKSMEESMGATVLVVIQNKSERSADSRDYVAYASPVWRRVIEDARTASLFQPVNAASIRRERIMSYEPIRLRPRLLESEAESEIQTQDLKFFLWRGTRVPGIDENIKDSFATVQYDSRDSRAKKIALRRRKEFATIVSDNQSTTTTSDISLTISDPPTPHPNDINTLVYAPPINHALRSGTSVTRRDDKDDVDDYPLEQFDPIVDQMTQRLAKGLPVNLLPADELGLGDSIETMWAEWEARADALLEIPPADVLDAQNPLLEDHELAKPEDAGIMARAHADGIRRSRLVHTRAILMKNAFELGAQTGADVAVFVHYDTERYYCADESSQTPFRMHVYATPDWRMRIVNVELLGGLRRMLLNPHTLLPLDNTLGYAMPSWMEGADVSMHTLQSKFYLPTGAIRFTFPALPIDMRRPPPGPRYSTSEFKGTLHPDLCFGKARSRMSAERIKAHVQLQSASETTPAPLDPKPAATPVLEPALFFHEFRVPKPVPPSQKRKFIFVSPMPRDPATSVAPQRMDRLQAVVTPPPPPIVFAEQQHTAEPMVGYGNFYRIQPLFAETYAHPVSVHL